MTTKIKFNIILIAILIAFGSCSKVDDYLDKAETGGRSEEQVFSTFQESEQFLANIYSELPSEYEVYYSAMTDEAQPTLPSSPEGWVSDNQFTPANNSIDVWPQYYASIRKANIFLKNKDKIPQIDGNEGGTPRMIGEAYFLRAFFYFQLFERYGRVPIFKEPLLIENNMKIKQNSVEEVVAFIKQDLDLAAAVLPVTYSSANLGRATKGTALGLKSRLLLYAASKLHNPTNDASKWKAAADAAKAVMDLNAYSLHPNYKLLFHTRVSPEIIFQHTYNYTNYTSENIPPSFSGLRTRFNPLQNLVDDYEMTNGKLPVLSYDQNNDPVVNPGSGYDPQKPYVNRDPRFYMSILYNGAKWQGKTLDMYIGAPQDGFNGSNHKNLSGYFFCKMLDETSAIKPTVRLGNYYWIYMRYAEILLNYAEAQNEYLTTPDNSIYAALNTIRSRPGVMMPNIPTGLTKDEMRVKIRHERRIELAFESHRFWDMKRWRIGHEIMEAGAWGMIPTKNTNGTFSYQRFLIQERVYPERNDLFPIAENVLSRNVGLEQNPGY